MSPDPEKFLVPFIHVAPREIYSNSIAPLRWLIKTDVLYRWTEKGQADNTFLRHYDPAQKNWAYGNHRPDDGAVTIMQECAVDDIG